MLTLLTLLTTAPRERLSLAREFPLTRRGLGRAPAQLSYLLLAPLRPRAAAAAHLLQTALSLPHAFERALALRD